MSIKFFHLFFIVLCTLFSLAVGGFMVGGMSAGGAANTAMGVLFLVLGVGLLVYAVHFYNKWKSAGFFL